MTPFFALFRRDFVLAYRQGIDLLVVVMFFISAGALFAFAIGPDRDRLGAIAAGIVLVMAALAGLLSLERLFQSDLDDGSLDQMALSPLPLELAVLAKALLHWLSAGLPLMAAGLPLAMMLGGPAGDLMALFLALALTTPALSLLGVLGAALTLGARRSGLLLTFVILPLFVPVLIFGAGIALPEFLSMGDERFPFIILSAIDLGLLGIVPWAAAAALRQAIN
jgi:heme exporter protein B